MEEDTAAAEDIFGSVFSKLNNFQKEIFQECIGRKKAGLSLPLGSGKTILSILLAVYFTRDNHLKTLIVVSKTLLQSWIFEIHKFFGSNSLKYQILHRDTVKNMSAWKLDEDTNIVLTTPDVIGATYKKTELKPQFVDQVYMMRYPEMYQNMYKHPDTPFLGHSLGEGILFSERWGCLFIDEIQRYTNIDTQWCQGLGAICSEVRWGLSGTMFNEPNIENILGFCVILDLPNMPRTLPDMKENIYSMNGHKFGGLNHFLISRKTNEAFVPPLIKEHIISHHLLPEEQIVYETLKHALNRIVKEAQKAKMCENKEEIRILNSQKLTMVLYLREALICPLLPITSIIVSTCDLNNRRPLSHVILSELKHLQLENWISDENSVVSSRMKEIVKCANKHPNEHVIIYACFSSFLNIMEYYLKEDTVLNTKRTIFRMTSAMSPVKRKKLLNDFKKSDNGILLLSYQLGSEGLNLQFASTVLLTDFWWNASTTKQAIGRIFRMDQIRDEINVYFFTSNTGIENILFAKQKSKLTLIEELKEGKITTSVPKISMNKVIRLISMEENTNLLQKIDYH